MMLYPRKKITKAGDKILKAKTEEEREEALNIINDWRKNHLYPLDELKRQLDEILKINEITPVLVSQRLKRLASIEYKLDLNPKMGLGGMNDIGGFRVVLETITDLNKLMKVLDKDFTTHKQINDYDYILEPKKETGYRSIHLVYEYRSDNKKYNKLKLELQIRTKLQHSWATAVETAGLLSNTSLKSNQGSDDWLVFFKIISSLFAIKEESSVVDEHKDISMENLMVSSYEYCDKLNVIYLFKALNVTVNDIIEKKRNANYYTINIDILKRTVFIGSYVKLDKALKYYMSLEPQIEEQKNAVVLVAASSIENLRKAYPSYFLDTTEFISVLKKINVNSVKLM